MGLGERWGPRGVKGTGFLCASGNLFPLSNFSVSLILLNKILAPTRVICKTWSQTEKILTCGSIATHNASLVKMKIEYKQVSDTSDKYQSPSLKPENGVRFSFISG